MPLQPLSSSAPPLSPLHSAALAGQTTITGDDRLWGMLAHILALASYLVGGLSFIGPLIVDVLKRDKSAFIGFHAREALNFNISLVVFMALSLLLAKLTTDFLLILVLALPVFGIVLSIRAALRANRGELYRYPLCIRFIK